MVNDKFFPQDTIQDYKNIISRYKDLYIICDTIIENMEKGIIKGYVQPKRIIKIVIKQFENILKDKDYYITVPIKIRKEFNDAINTYFVTSVQKLLVFLKTKYLKKCRNTIGYYDLPNGRDMYKFFAKSYTTTDMSIDSIHKLGLSEVKRIYNEMKTIKQDVGFKGNMKQFSNYLRDDPKFFFKTRNEVLKAYEKEQTYIEKNVLPKYFHTMKNSNKFLSHNYQIKAIPKYQETDSPMAYYYMPSKDIKRKGCFYLNMHNLKALTKYTVKALSLHEGNPGHHYQLTNIIDNKLPIYVMYSDYIAYIEGWALYSESLDNYTDHYEYYGKLSYEMLRALRLVIDTGIHHYGWSYKKTYKYFKKYYNGADSEIINEINRYIVDPGQALAYKIGELTIKRLRSNWKGDIKDFHSKILEYGPLPLNILEAKFK
jgi:uncharacterized protein (DUF885 family)